MSPATAGSPYGVTVIFTGWPEPYRIENYPALFPHEHGDSPWHVSDATFTATGNFLANDKITITPTHEPTLVTPPPLTREILEPIEAVSAQMWPGVPVVPTLAAGATDGRFTINAGIPTYGISGIFHDPDGSGVHGLNERLRVRSLYEGHEFLYRLVKRYAGGR